MASDYIIYVEVFTCGQITGRYGFGEKDNILTTLGCIEHLSKELKWDSYKIAHICSHGDDCPLDYKNNSIIILNKTTK